MNTYNPVTRLTLASLLSCVLVSCGGGGGGGGGANTAGSDSAGTNSNGTDPGGNASATALVQALADLPDGAKVDRMRWLGGGLVLLLTSKQGRTHSFAGRSATPEAASSWKFSALGDSSFVDLAGDTKISARAYVNCSGPEVSTDAGLTWTEREPTRAQSSCGIEDWPTRSSVYAKTPAGAYSFLGSASYVGDHMVVSEDGLNYVPAYTTFITGRTAPLQNGSGTSPAIPVDIGAIMSSAASTEVLVFGPRFSGGFPGTQCAVYKGTPPLSRTTAWSVVGSYTVNGTDCNVSFKYTATPVNGKPQVVAGLQTYNSGGGYYLPVNEYLMLGSPASGSTVYQWTRVSVTHPRGTVYVKEAFWAGANNEFLVALHNLGWSFSADGGATWKHRMVNVASSGTPDYLSPDSGAPVPGVAAFYTAYNGKLYKIALDGAGDAVATTAVTASSVAGNPVSSGTGSGVSGTGSGNGTTGSTTGTTGGDGSTGGTGSPASYAGTTTGVDSGNFTYLTWAGDGFTSPLIYVNPDGPSSTLVLGAKALYITSAGEVHADVTDQSSVLRRARMSGLTYSGGTLFYNGTAVATLATVSNQPSWNGSRYFACAKDQTKQLGVVTSVLQNGSGTYTIPGC